MNCKDIKILIYNEWREKATQMSEPHLKEFYKKYIIPDNSQVKEEDFTLALCETEFIAFIEGMKAGAAALRDLGIIHETDI